MKKYGLFTLLVLALGGLCWFNLPWWTLAISAGMAAILTKMKPLGAFATGFAAGTLLYSSMAMFFNTINGGQLGGQIGEIFHGISSAEMIWATGALGGLLAGLGALTGSFFRAIFDKDMDLTVTMPEMPSVGDLRSTLESKIPDADDLKGKLAGKMRIPKLPEIEVPKPPKIN